MAEQDDEAGADHVILAPGGEILFVEAEGLGIIGTCALMQVDGNVFELTKMGVRETARGLKAGEFLTKLTPVWAGGFGAAVITLLRIARFGNHFAQRTRVLTVKCLAGAFDHSVLLRVTD